MIMNEIPFYGLNQLPSFIVLLPMTLPMRLNFENLLKCLSKNSLSLDNREETAGSMTGIQVYAMMKYIEENHPNTRCWQRLYFSIIEKLQSDELGLTGNTAVSIC
jgi:hypothetical protein